jgi:hypothetical protein
MVYGRDAGEGQLPWEIGGLDGPAAARTIQQIVKGRVQPHMGLIATMQGTGDSCLWCFLGLREVARCREYDVAHFVPSRPIQRHRYRTSYPRPLRFLRDRAGSGISVIDLSDMERLADRNVDDCVAWRHLGGFLALRDRVVRLPSTGSFLPWT